MSRRDTIIIAVLINSALLTILFMLAVNIKEEVPDVEHIIAEAKPTTQPSQKTLSPKNGRDQLDIVLKDFSIPSSTHQTRGKIERKGQTVSKSKEIKKNYVEVTVKHGDYLGKIAKDNGTTISEIMKANHLINERIDVGQVLRIPVSSTSTKTAAAQKPHQEQQYYIVQRGDNPWKIARKFRVGFTQLLKLNDLDEERARNLKPGDKIRVK